jgi:flagellar operon protein
MVKMKISQLNTEVRLLEIANRRKADASVSKSERPKTFKDTFSREMARAGNVNFSKHARQRLFSRGIELSDSKLDMLSHAIDKAAVKGSKDTLILDDDAAYVVSVPSRTVISAFGRDSLREGVFTSIDSAVIL